MEIHETFMKEVGMILEQEMKGAKRRKLWAVILRLVPVFEDGKFYVRFGEVVGFGDTPEQAIIHFESEMKREKR